MTTYDKSPTLGLNLPKGTDTFDYDVFLRQNFNTLDSSLTVTNQNVAANTSQLADIVHNVKTYGAKGDGITDDTQAIKNAIASLTDGSTLLIPPSTGNYIISDALNVSSKNNITIIVNGHIKQTKHGYCGIEIQNCKHVVVQGSGQIEGYNLFPSRTFDVNNRESNEKTRAGGGFSTVLKNGMVATTAQFGGGYEGNVGSGVIIYDTSVNVTVKDLEIFGFNYGGVSVGWMGSTAPYNQDILVTNCYIHDCQNSGVDFCKTIGVTVDGCTIHNIGHPNTTINDTEITMGYGVTALYSNSVAENIMVRNCRFYKCYRKGVDFHAAKGNASAVNNEIKDSYVHGIATPHNTSTVVWSELDIRGNRVITCGNAPNYLTSLEYTSGILFDATFGGMLADNIVRDCSIRGIEVVVHDYAQGRKIVLNVINNQVISTNGLTAYGLNVTLAYNDCILNIIGNHFQTDHVTGRGAYIFSNSAVTNNMVNVMGNTFIAPTTGTTYALQLYQVQEGQVSGNNCVGVFSLYTRSHGNIKRDNTNTLIGTVDSTIPTLLSARTGTLTYNGDGTTTTKTIAHGLTGVPTFFHVIPNSVDAGTAGIKYVTADATNITVTFNTAPISGTSNVVLKWKAEL